MKHKRENKPSGGAGRRRGARVCCIAGARPNFLKIAPLMEQFRCKPRLRVCLVHTGQHYDTAMSRTFFHELEIPAPDIHLGVGSGPHGRQTGRILERLEPVLMAERPDLVVVVGDVNSTLAGALAAVKLAIPVAHVEAGLRSFDRTMPEEINRVLTDAISSLLFCTEPAAVRNLKREGIPDERVHLVGNVMIDSLVRQRPRAAASDVLSRLGLEPGRYVVLTLHRPANVDDSRRFRRILSALKVIQREMPVVFPVHPRTRKRLQQEGMAARLKSMRGLRLTPPLGYHDFLKLMMEARAVLTDSGGIQEETTYLGVPCLTVRENTERPVTIRQGTNRLVGTHPEGILSAWRDLMEGRWSPRPRVPKLWDGHAAERIAEIIRRFLGVT